MTTLRNFAFLGLLIAALFVDQEGAKALIPPDYDCPTGCDCDEEIPYSEVSGYCENEAGINGVCDDIERTCIAYCEDAYENWVNDSDPGHSCWLQYIVAEGCWPYGLEPPTSFVCGCMCQS